MSYRARFACLRWTLPLAAIPAVATAQHTTFMVPTLPGSGGAPTAGSGAGASGWAEMPEEWQALSELHYPEALRRGVALESGTGPLTRLVAGDLNADGHDDVIGLDGGTPVLFYGAGIFDSDTRFGTSPATDLSYLPGTLTPAPAHVVVTGASGLERVWIDYEDPNGQFVQVAPLGPAEWAGARRVVAVRPQPYQAWALAGLDATGQAILRLRDPLTAPIPSPPIPLPGEALDLFAADVLGDGGEELVVILRSGVSVYDPSGVELASFDAVLAEGFGVRLPGAQDSKDRIAFVARYPGEARHWLHVWAPGGAFEPPLDLGTLGPHGLAAGDVDRDGNADLCMAIEEAAVTLALGGGAAEGERLPGAQAAAEQAVLQSFVHRGALVFFHRGTDVTPASPASFGFGLEESVPIDLGWNERTGGVSHAPPLLFDLTEDGDPELVLFSEGLRRLMVAGNAHVDQAQFVVRPQPLVSHVTIDDEDAGGGIARYELELDEPDHSPAWANALLVEQWVQAEPSGVHPEGVHRFALNLPLDWEAQHELYLYVPPLELGLISHLELRLVQLGPSGEIERSGPSTFQAFALYTAGSSYIETSIVPSIVGREAVAQHYAEPPWDEEDLTWPPPPGGVTGFGGPFVQHGLAIYLAIPPPQFGTAELGVGVGDLPIPPKFVDDSTNPPRPPSIDN